jgi:hypothetical protein
VTVSVDFNVEQIDPLTMVGNEAVSRRDLMSPYVWRLDDGSYGRLEEWRFQCEAGRLKG